MTKLENLERRAANGGVGEVRTIPGEGAQTAPGAGTISLAQILSVAQRRWRLIAAIIVAVVISGLIITLLITPKFTSTATIEIQREATSFVKLEGASQESKQGMPDQEFYETQYGLLRAQNLGELVATNLRLYDDENFFRMMGAPSKPWYRDGVLSKSVATKPARVREAADILLKNLDVQPRRLSRLVDISLTTPDAALSKRVVDAWSTNFIRATLERRFDATVYARQFLEGRLSQLRKRIDESERALVSYATQQEIVNLPSGGQTPAGGTTVERSIVAENLVSLNEELNKAIADRITAESRLRSTGGEVTEGLDNVAISTLRSRRAELTADYAKMMVQFKPDYPPAASLKSQIDRLDQSLNREEARVKNTLQGTYAANRARETELQERVARLKADVLSLRERSIQYNIFQRDADTNRQLYDALLQRYKEIGVAGGVGVNNISVVDPAKIALKPSSPRMLTNLAASLLAGMLLAAAICFLLEQIDQGIRDPREVENVFGLPLLGTVPKTVDVDSYEALQDTKSYLSEAYLSVQTNLSFSTDHGVPRTLSVTSCRPAEGKTTTSYALSRSLARLGSKVIIVDTDMRSPSMHHLMNVTNERGLSNFLSGATDTQSLIQPTPFENLQIMSAGPQPPSAAELLSGDRFGTLLEELLTRYDHVVCDSPPVMGLADAPLIASHVEGVVFVVQAELTQRALVQSAISRLFIANANLLGIVLTKFDSRRVQHSYGYEYGYGNSAERRAD